MAREQNQPEKRPGPFAQDPSRTPPTKEQRENDYQPEKKETGEAIKQKPETRLDADLEKLTGRSTNDKGSTH
jgi:hypothetical protein